MANALRNLLWDTMLDADMNVRYWGYLGRKYSVREKYLKIFVAIFSTTSAVGSWALWDAYPLLWKGLISASAIIAIALPILNYSGDVAVAADQKGKWTRLLGQAELLWAKIEHDPSINIETEYNDIQDAIAKLSTAEATIALDQKLRQRSYTEVCAVRQNRS